LFCWRLIIEWDSPPGPFIIDYGPGRIGYGPRRIDYEPEAIGVLMTMLYTRPYRNKNRTTLSSLSPYLIPHLFSVEPDTKYFLIRPATDTKRELD
jgi:hypothetical protein